MFTCGKREFQTWEEAKEYIDKFNQREKERRERAFYYWHNLHVKNIIESGVMAGIVFIYNMLEEMKENEEFTEEDFKSEIFRKKP